jgi:hypothetical protein
MYVLPEQHLLLHRTQLCACGKGAEPLYRHYHSYPAMHELCAKIVQRGPGVLNTRRTDMYCDVWPGVQEEQTCTVMCGQVYKRNRHVL